MIDEPATLVLLPNNDKLQTKLVVNGKKYKGAKLQGEVTVKVKVIAESPAALSPAPQLFLKVGKLEPMQPSYVYHN